MTRWALAYGAALLVVGILDAIWLGWLARDFYATRMTAFAAESVAKVPAAIFYFAYPAGLLALALSPTPSGLGDAVLRSALVGLVAYGTYDLTSLAVVRGFGAGLAAVDVAWGTALSAVTGAVAWAVLQRA